MPEPIDQLLSRLVGAKPTGPGRWMARCPAHEDRGPSLSIRELDDGRVLMHCFAGCGVDDVARAAGLELSDLFPKTGSDENRTARIRRAWSVHDLVRALRAELGVAWILLSDIAAGREFTAGDRNRAKLARERCEALIRELAE